MKNQKEIELEVNLLQEICNERKEGYRSAAKILKDSSLKTLFEEYAHQSEKFVEELAPFSEKALSEVGTTVKAHISRIADNWRVWMNMDSTYKGGARKALLEACVSNIENVIEENEHAENFKSVLNVATEAIYNEGGRKALMEACVKGEESAIKNYEDSLSDEDLPVNLRSVIEKQLATIKSCYEGIKFLFVNLNSVEP